MLGIWLVLTLSCTTMWVLRVGRINRPNMARESLGGREGGREGGMDGG